MKKMETLCKVKRSRYEDFRSEIVAVVSQQKYIREERLRVSSKKELLCSPCTIDQWQP